VDTVRRLGLTALVGGAGLVVANLLFVLNPGAPDLETAADYLTIAVLAAAVLLTLVGLVGLHRRQRNAYGRLGRIGVVLALIGQVGAGAANIRWNEWVFLVGLAGLVGFLLLALAIARAPALPHWSGFLLLAGFVGLLVVRDGDLGIALDGIAWLVVGYLLWSSSSETVATARPLQV
jgi:hypothetical protein